MGLVLTPWSWTGSEEVLGGAAGLLQERTKGKEGCQDPQGEVTAGPRAEPPPQNNRSLSRVIWGMMVAIEEMWGLDTSTRGCRRRGRPEVWK